MSCHDQRSIIMAVKIYFYILTSMALIDYKILLTERIGYTTGTHSDLLRMFYYQTSSKLNSVTVKELQEIALGEDFESKRELRHHQLVRRPWNECNRQSSTEFDFSTILTHIFFIFAKKTNTSSLKPKAFLPSYNRLN